MGDVRPVPGGGGAASLLGRSPEQRNRSIPSGTRERDGSGWLRFPPLWETAVWYVVCGVWCVMCVVLCGVQSCCIVVCRGVWCVVVCDVVCVFLLSLCSRRRCAIQNENPISRSIGKKRLLEEMRSGRISANVFSYSSTSIGACEKGQHRQQWQCAQRLLEEMRSGCISAPRT